MIKWILRFFRSENKKWDRFANAMNGWYAKENSYIEHDCEFMRREGIGEEEIKKYRQSNNEQIAFLRQIDKETSKYI